MELEPLQLHCLMVPKAVRVHSKSLK